MEEQGYEVAQLVEAPKGTVACTMQAEARTDLEAPVAAALVEVRPETSGAAQGVVEVAAIADAEQQQAITVEE